MIRDVVLLGVEDPLSEAVGKAVLASVRMSASQTFGLKGNTYLRKKVSALNKTAKAFPVLLLTDLDSPTGCAPQLIRDWISEPLEPGFIFRVAVMETESWIMAHRDAFASFLAVSRERVPRNPDRVRDVKEKLLSIAKASRRREVRADILPARGSTAKVGPAYNARLAEFVRTEWDAKMAATVSPSLNRTLSALERFRDG